MKKATWVMSAVVLALAGGGAAWWVLKPGSDAVHLAQFLIEAVTLSLIGGAIGVVLGALATWGVASFAGWQVSMTLSSILLAAGFSAFVGIFFGFYPARRASRLLPIQALRYE